MNYLNGLFIGFIGVLSIAWSSKLYKYFYGLTIADQVSMIMVMILVLILLIKINLSLKKSYESLVLIVLLPYPYLVYPILSKLIQITELSWLLVSSFLIVSVFGAVIIKTRVKQFILLVAFTGVFFYPFDFEGAQRKFFDKVVDYYSTRKADIQLVKWKEDYWLYYDNQLQYTTVDMHIYQEAYIQPVMQLVDSGANVLMIGGDNGVLESELSKFNTKVALTILPWDSSYYKWIRSNKRLLFREFDSKRVLFDEVFFEFLESHPSSFDLIVVDLPDPEDLAYTQFYSKEFLEACFRSLKPRGIFVSQSGDVFKNKEKSNKIWRTAGRAGFYLLPYYAQIPTIGHWSWFIGSKTLPEDIIQNKLTNVSPEETKWWNQDAMNLMMNSGRKTFFEDQDSSIFILNH